MEAVVSTVRCLWQLIGHPACGKPATHAYTRQDGSDYPLCEYHARIARRDRWTPVRKLVVRTGAALLLLFTLASPVMAAQDPDLHCPDGGAKTEASGGNQAAINATVLPAGTRFCVKAGPGNTGILTADGVTTLQGYSPDGKDVSYFVVYPPVTTSTTSTTRTTTATTSTTTATTATTATTTQTSTTGTVTSTVPVTVPVTVTTTAPLTTVTTPVTQTATVTQTETAQAAPPTPEATTPPTDATAASTQPDTSLFLLLVFAVSGLTIYGLRRGRA